MEYGGSKRRVEKSNVVTGSRPRATRGRGDITACSFHFTLVDRHFAHTFGSVSTNPISPQHVAQQI